MFSASFYMFVSKDILLTNVYARIPFLSYKIASL